MRLQDAAAAPRRARQSRSATPATRAAHGEKLDFHERAKAVLSRKVPSSSFHLLTRSDDQSRSCVADGLTFETSPVR